MIRTGPTSEPSENTQDYRWVFVERVHQLLKLGYDRLTPSALREEEETTITGIFVNAIEEVLDDPVSEDWVDFFSVHDDPPVKVRSHGIEEDASRALHTRNLRDFLTLRRERLIEIERQFVKNLGLDYAEKAS